MKIFTVIAVVCYLFVATNSLPTRPESPPPRDPIAICSFEFDIPKDVTRKLINHTIEASNENEKCVLSCYFSVKGYYVNGTLKIDFGKILESHKRFVPKSEQHNLEEIFKACESKMDYNKNDCEVAYDAYHCFFSSHH